MLYVSVMVAPVFDASIICNEMFECLGCMGIYSLVGIVIVGQIIVVYRLERVMNSLY